MFNRLKIRMAEENRRKLIQLLKLPQNSHCADCGIEGPEWASYNIGIFVCTQCAGFHRNLGSHISKVKSVFLDNWDSTQVEIMENMGNDKAQEKYEVDVPLCYKKPCPTDVQVLKEQWIQAKYDRQEFLHTEEQIYVKGFMEGHLWKRGKEDGKFHLRKFVLNEAEDTFKYYVKEHKEPKAVIRISELNATFCPMKVNSANAMQITYIKDGTTRNVFVYSDDGKDIVNWYMAIRSAKLNRLQIAFPKADIKELAQQLTREFIKEGWLKKKGPRASDAYRRRWFTLDNRRLMYLTNPLDPYPKGEIFLGYMGNGFCLHKILPAGIKESGFGFILETPERSFVVGADTEEERREWMDAIEKILERPLTPQDSNISILLMQRRKKKGRKSKLEVSQWQPS
ncbi:arf-GAP with dual PH domain-containing protein 1-like isoform X2 [Tachypleus tridentatus]|uniref:arf-GAP with dual PH domain-containing protein 1-like isoform X2 n=1 Tax=Tachypleus tridentatus TaxID=6853 RepID=UPI003FD28DA0